MNRWPVLTDQETERTVDLLKQLSAFFFRCALAGCFVIREPLP